MNRQIVMMRGLNFSYYATSALLLPFLPVYFEQKGFTSSQIGLLTMFGPFVAIFAQPLWGYISDRYNKLKLIIFALWAVSLLSSVGVFTTNGFSAAFVYMLLLYFFLLPAVPLLDSMTIKATTESGVPYGSVRLYGSIGFSIVAMSAGYVLGKMGGVTSIPYIYWSLWVLPFALLLFMRGEKGSGTHITLESLGSVMKNKQFMWFLLIIFILMVPHRMNDALLALHLRNLGANESLLGWAWALAALSEVPTFALLGRYLHKFHELALLGIVAILYTIRWLLYWAIDDPFVLVLLQASHSITFAVFWITAVQYAVRIVPENMRSTGQSLLAAVFLGLAGITGGFVGGLIKDSFGGEYMYSFGAVMAFVAAVMLLGTHAYARTSNSLR